MAQKADVCQGHLLKSSVKIAVKSICTVYAGHKYAQEN